MFEAGAHVGIDIGTDGQITAFLQAVRDRLLRYVTEAWIGHSPHVVTGLEEELRHCAAALAPTASPATGAPATGVRLSLAPQLDAFALLGKYAQHVKVGTMTVAEFDVHKLCILAAGPSLLPALPVLSVALVPSSSVVPSPLALGAAVPPLPVLPSLSVVPPPSLLAPLPSQASAPSPGHLCHHLCSFPVHPPSWHLPRVFLHHLCHSTWCVRLPYLQLWLSWCTVALPLLLAH